ncbi:TrwC relaxase [Actinacidiphila yanglinensis]|uniref:TrwC relaxase n=1 Tax=Actinacidiphila yanglinensis TaxID=310779 RepID=A0A1H6DJW0_9ACTN|nr:relaxase domain-containing protein [Actinacidiphila yanglinensis]SEG85474.1 TrwC relaxase [Actinacidiphila yanglinensis]
MHPGRAFIHPTYDDGADQEPGECVGAAAAGVGVAAGRARGRRDPRGHRGRDAAVADVLAWLEDEAVVVYSGPGGAKWERPVGGLVIARFRHWDSQHRTPLLHDHLVVSVKVLGADGKWGHLDSRRLYAHVVAAGALYNQRILEEVSARLGLATEPRTPTPGLRPVMELVGVPPELIHTRAAAGDRDRRGAAGADRLDVHPAA